jgi:hypothetical protein
MTKYEYSITWAGWGKQPHLYQSFIKFNQARKQLGFLMNDPRLARREVSEWEPIPVDPSISSYSRV